MLYGPPLPSLSPPSSSSKQLSSWPCVPMSLTMAIPMLIHMTMPMAMPTPKPTPIPTPMLPNHSLTHSLTHAFPSSLQSFLRPPPPSPPPSSLHTQGIPLCTPPGIPHQPFSQPFYPIIHYFFHLLIHRPSLNIMQCFHEH